MESDIILGKSGYKWTKVEYIIYLGGKKGMIERRCWENIEFRDNVLFFF